MLLLTEDGGPAARRVKERRSGGRGEKDGEGERKQRRFDDGGGRFSVV